MLFAALGCSGRKSNSEVIKHHDDVVQSVIRDHPKLYEVIDQETFAEGLLLVPYMEGNDLSFTTCGDIVMLQLQSLYARDPDGYRRFAGDFLRSRMNRTMLLLYPWVGNWREARIRRLDPLVDVGWDGIWYVEYDVYLARKYPNRFIGHLRENWDIFAIAIIKTALMLAGLLWVVRGLVHASQKLMRRQTRG